MFKHILIGAAGMAALTCSAVAAAPAATLETQTVAANSPYKVGPLVIERPWSRAVARSAKNAAGYFLVRNTGSTPDRLIGATAGISMKATLHNHIVHNNMMMMRPVAAIEVPAGGSVALKPGGFHMMFEGLHRQIKQGETFPLTLVFANAGKVEVMVEVKSVRHRGNTGHDMKSMKGHDMKSK